MKESENLAGCARLEEPYGVHNYIEFYAETGGHIRVKGIMNSMRYGYEQELSFENEIDQTYLKDFTFGLLADFSKYSG
ncbi:MAG: hypothetical protein IJ716_00690 [Lachnospiraceae bacterium]|nr:hypothetical protein [Lachnospiraceae bacterium]